jgi:hypothetical protein
MMQYAQLSGQSGDREPSECSPHRSCTVGSEDGHAHFIYARPVGSSAGTDVDSRVQVASLLHLLASACRQADLGARLAQLSAWCR